MQTHLRTRPVGRRPSARTIAALAAGGAMVGTAITIAPHLLHPLTTRTVAASTSLASSPCASGYQPTPGFTMDVCLTANGSVVTPSVNVTSIGSTGNSCQIVLEIWDDAGHRLNNSASAGFLDCKTGPAPGRALDLNTLQNVTARTAPDGSLTVHAFARLYLDGKGIYHPGQGDSPTVTVLPSRIQANDNAANKAVPAHTSPANMTGPAGQKDIPTVTATPVDSFFGNAYATLTQDAGIVCYEASLEIPCWDNPEAFTQAVVDATTDAHIDPRLLMAVIMNERGMNVQAIPHMAAGEFARWLLSLVGKDHSLGQTNMSSAAFHDAQQAAGPNSDLAKHAWADLITDPVLAIDAAAWLLRGLEEQLPPTWPAQYKRDELLAIGYNGGGSVMTGVAGGLTPDQADPKNPGKVAWYVDHVDGNWDNADTLVCHLGMFTCS